MADPAPTGSRPNRLRSSTSGGSQWRTFVRASASAHQAWARAWETIRYAIDDNARTIRLCVILLVLGLMGITPFLVLALAHHVLG